MIVHIIQEIRENFRQTLKKTVSSMQSRERDSSDSEDTAIGSESFPQLGSDAPTTLGGLCVPQCRGRVTTDSWRGQGSTISH